MKIDKLTITSEDIEVLEEALSCSELSWRDLLKKIPKHATRKKYIGRSRRSASLVLSL